MKIPFKNELFLSFTRYRLMTTASAIRAELVDIANRDTYPAEILIENGFIKDIKRIEGPTEHYILPGFVDAHVHIESAMVCPCAFSIAATPSGTVATVSDPHEIANVCGAEGVRYMIENAKKAALKFHFGAPSCVPATDFESAGAELNAEDIATLMADPDIFYLAEMMNFPGVLSEDKSVMQKINAAKASGKPIDGHAPGLRGEMAKKYTGAGISTDHECTGIEEAIDKLDAGMKILIREGSAAKNFKALLPLFGTHASRLMFCSDDKHPDELVKGHIDRLVARARRAGYDLYDVLHAACIAPVEHYQLPVGLLRIGDPADLIVVKDLEDFKVLQTYIDGVCVAEHGLSLERFETPALINNFSRDPIGSDELALPAGKENGPVKVKVIEALDGQLLTNSIEAELEAEDGFIRADTGQDILKIAVVNRYREARPAIGFIRNFGLRSGAIASSVAHDSHNIVAVGVSDEDIAAAVNIVIGHKGGISVHNDGKDLCMPLPIAGLMTDKTALEAAREYETLDIAAKELGSTLTAPFMTLSFMALPVIPSLKMSDKGLFNVDCFNFTSVTQSEQ